MKGKNIYFKGLIGTEATFDYAVKNLGLADSNVTDVLLTGSSAGGLGAFYFADILGDLLPPTVKYSVAPDSGFFINYFFNDPSTYMVESVNSLLSLGDPDFIIPLGCPYLHD